jgi:hypothetical protein
MRIFQTTLALLLVGISSFGCNPFASSWADDCETAYKERLRSPATYKRIEADVFAVDMTIDEYIAQNTDIMPSQVQNLRKNKPPIKKWTVLITYDANNAMGVPIRDKFYCEEVNRTGEEPRGGRSEGLILLMEVNGKSNIDLQMEALKAQSGQ